MGQSIGEADRKVCRSAGEGDIRRRSTTAAHGVEVNMDEGQVNLISLIKMMIGTAGPSSTR